MGMMIVCHAVQGCVSAGYVRGTSIVAAGTCRHVAISQALIERIQGEWHQGEWHQGAGMAWLHTRRFELRKLSRSGAPNGRHKQVRIFHGGSMQDVTLCDVVEGQVSDASDKILSAAMRASTK